MQAYMDYFAGKLEDHEHDHEALERSMLGLPSTD